MHASSRIALKITAPKLQRESYPLLDDTAQSQNTLRSHGSAHIIGGWENVNVMYCNSLIGLLPHLLPYRWGRGSWLCVYVIFVLSDNVSYVYTVNARLYIHRES